MPAASRRFKGYSGEVRRKRSRAPACTLPLKCVAKPSMCRSVLPAADRIGVSTSSTPRCAKKSRISVLSRARSSSARRLSRSSSTMLLQELRQLRLVPDLDAEFPRLVQLGTGGFTGDHERSLLRDRTGDLGAQRFEFVLRLVARHR